MIFISFENDKDVSSERGNEVKCSNDANNSINISTDKTHNSQAKNRKENIILHNREATKAHANQEKVQLTQFKLTRHHQGPKDENPLSEGGLAFKHAYKF